MRKHPELIRRRDLVEVCMCCPAVGFLCHLHREGGPRHGIAPETVEEADGLAEEDDRLNGYGYRGADQDGYDGEEWVSPEEDNFLTMVEAARVLLDAVEI